MFSIGIIAWMIGWFLAFYLSDMTWFYIGIILLFALQPNEVWRQAIKGFKLIRERKHL